MIKKLSLIKDFFEFLWRRKLWWLIPMLIVFIIVGVLVIFVGSSPLAPIVYPLF